MAVTRSSPSVSTEQEVSFWRTTATTPWWRPVARCQLFHVLEGRLLAGLDEIEFDVACPVLHGPYVEDRAMDRATEMVDTPYVGCGITTPALARENFYQTDIRPTEDSDGAIRLQLTIRLFPYIRDNLLPPKEKVNSSGWDPSNPLTIPKGEPTLK